MTNETIQKVDTFSLFADFHKAKPAERDACLHDVYTIVTTGKFAGNNLAATTAALRAETSTAIQAQIKKTLPFLTVSARFDEAAVKKDASEPLRHSGHLCFDFDHLSEAEHQRLHQLFVGAPDTALLFTSPRGEGLKRFVTVTGITTDNHTAVYYAGMLHHWQHYQTRADETCVNVNRGTFLPIDTDAYHNASPEAWDAETMVATYPDAERKAKYIAKQYKSGGKPELIPADVISWELPAPKAAKKTSQKPTVGTITVDTGNARQVAEMLVNGLKETGGTVTDGYAEWFAAGCALKRELGEEGFGYFDELSQQDASKYDPAEVRRQWDAIDVSKAQHSAGTLVHLAREAGIAVPALARGTGAVTVQQQGSKLTQNDVRDAIKQLYDIYFDAGSDTYYYATPGNLNPFDFEAFSAKSTMLNRLLGQLENLNVHTSKRKLEETIFNPDTYTEINYLPLQLDWLAAHYDGQDHITPLLASIRTEDDALFAVQFRKWMVNMIAQVYGTDGASRNDNALVLVGEQGRGKTGFFEFLLWDDRYFATKPDFNFENKEHLLLMNSKALILLDEMGQYNKADIKILKAAFSQTKITADRKFHETRDYARNASFAGCSNNTDFLKDDTGDRRFLVFQMLAYDKAAYNAVNKPQLWGQVVSMYKAGFDFRFSAEEIEGVIQRNLGSYTMHKPEDTFISEALEVTKNPGDFLSNAELEILINRYKQDYHVREYIGQASIRAKLKMAGVTVGAQKKIAGKVLKGFIGVRAQRHHAVATVTGEREAPAEASGFTL